MDWHCESNPDPNYEEAYAELAELEWVMDLGNVTVDGDKAKILWRCPYRHHKDFMEILSEFELWTIVGLGQTTSISLRGQVFLVRLEVKEK